MSENRNLLTFLAFVPTALFMSATIGLTVAILEAPDAPDPPPLAWLNFVVVAVASILSVAATIAYIVHVSRNSTLDAAGRLLWILGILFANALVIIPYFLLHVRKTPPPPPNSRAEWDARLQD